MKDKTFEQILSEKLGQYPMMVTDPELTFEAIQEQLREKKKRRFGFWFIIILPVFLFAGTVSIMSYMDSKLLNKKIPSSQNTNVDQSNQSSSIPADENISVNKKQPENSQPQNSQPNSTSHSDLNTQSNQFSMKEKTVNSINTVKNNYETKFISRNSNNINLNDTTRESKVNENEPQINNLPLVKLVDSMKTTDQSTLITDSFNRKKDSFIDATALSYQNMTYVPEKLSLRSFQDILNDLKDERKGDQNSIVFAIYPHISIMGMKNEITAGSTPSSYIDSLYLSSRQSQDKFMLGLQTGIGTRMTINKYFTMTLGVNYSYYSFNQAHDDSVNFISTVPFGTYASRMESIEIPFTLGANIPMGRFGLAIDIGAAPSFNIYASYLTKPVGSNLLYETNGLDSLSEVTPVNLYLTGNILLTYSINNRFRLFAGFTSRYGVFSVFNEGNQINQHPFGFGSRFGFEFLFGKRRQ